MQPTHRSKILLLLTVISLLWSVPWLQAAEQIELTTGQTVYVPAYSHIYHGNKETPLLLSVTLSIRNVDLSGSLTIRSINYHETEGELVRKFIDEPVVLGPLGSVRFVVPQRDNTGGSGANFIVEWQAEKPINPPILETVMIGTQSQLGISFTSRGQPLKK
ncbi:MAG: DUF3124 domain-containing protein [Desulforhopalus sp.]